MCQELKADEILALEAIYQDEFVVEDGDGHCYAITIKPSWSTGDDRVMLNFKLPEQYPLEASPSITISAPWMDREDKAHLINELGTIADQQPGEPILYNLIEKARELINQQLEPKQPVVVVVDHVRENICESTNVASSSSACDIKHGKAFVDRRSTFQAHLTPVHEANEVDNALNQLKASNKKIATATHNIWAYRIVKDDGIVAHDCDDDGENGAGSRLLHLLEIVDARNVLVIVTRWYGGIQLGPDRFRHINNVARNLLIEYDYIVANKSKK